MTYARFLQRLCAFAIDFALWLAFVLGLGKLAGGGITYDHGHGSHYLWFAVEPGHVAADLAVLFGWLYCAGCESSVWQATLGKRLLGIAVTDENGGRISFLRASCRHWAKAISLLPLFVGYLIALFTPRKQTVHDLISGSLVVDAREVSPAPVESLRIVTIALVLAGTTLFGGMALMSEPATSVYIVPLGQVTASDASLLADDVAEAADVKATVVDGFAVPEAIFNSQRQQFDTKSIEAQIRARYPNLLKRDNVVIGVTSDDMYTSAVPRAQFAFSSRDAEHVAVVSLARVVYGSDTLVRLRADRLIERQVGVLHFHKPLSDDPSSILYANVTSVADIDRMTEPNSTQ